MVEDYGFELPDTRHTFLTDTGKVQVVIVRHWYTDEENDEPQFKISFDIHYADFEGVNKATVNLPVGTQESLAIRVAHELWEEDTKATQDWDDTEAMAAAERRMGA